MQAITKTFSALGDQTRFSIVEQLLTRGEQSAGDLQSVANMSAPAISRHLKILRQAGVINQRVDRQKRIYSVNPVAIQAVNAWVEYHRNFWENKLNRLEEALNMEGPDNG
ncbi:MAG: DNA-binding transcriptional ArsR family regulator [Paracoccaceae bacterium]|jgi:DNA-binding transcriptional ArsR family regulator